MSTLELEPEQRIIIALDFPDFKTGTGWIDRLKDRISTFKIGPVMFLDTNLNEIGHITENGPDIFLDLKLHDIPVTLAKSVCHIVDSGISMFTVHSFGGFEMMDAVCNETHSYSKMKDVKKPVVLAVTVLTSHDSDTLSSIGIYDTPENQVLRLADLAEKAGVDGLVCSGHEAQMLRKNFGDRFLLVVPGVRTTVTSNSHDQKRVITPSEAVEEGADYIVVGRAVTESPDPEAEVESIISSLR